MSLALDQAPTLAAPRDTNADALVAAARRERWMLLALALPALLLIAVIVLGPIAWLSALSFKGPDGITIANYVRLLHPSYAITFRTTFELAFLVTGICLALGYPLAYFMTLLPGRAANVVLLFVLFPFWTSLLVRTYAWLVLLQRRGLINTWLGSMGVIDEPLRIVHNFTGTAIGMTHIMLPFMVLPLYAAMKAIDGDYGRAAANLGASPVKAFWHVFFPLSLPGLFAGLVVVFVLCLGFYVTPALLGGGRVMMWSMQIERNLSMYSDWGATSALGVVLLVVTLGILWVMSRLVRLDRVMGVH
jgi:ABC-type spermidine/putrescine transport system permease subunit I